MTGDLADPTKGMTGSVVQRVTGLSDDDLDRYQRYWERAFDHHRGEGQEYSAWWCSKHVSIAASERRRRAAGEENQ
jgi:hypothetical protein